MRSAIWSLVTVAVTCAGAPARDVLRISNRSDTAAYLVLQEQADKTGAIRRWVREIAAGDSASIQLPDPNIDRLLVAYKPGPAGKLTRILAVHVVSKDCFYFSGDCVVFLVGSDPDYYFVSPYYKGGPKPRLAKVAASGTPEISEEDFKKLQTESDRNRLAEEKK